jgi:DNA-binding CsgD family transcriptional regulator
LIKHLEKHLSKRDAIQLLDIAHRCLSCSSQAQLRDVLRLVQNVVSFDCAVCGCPEIRSILLDPKIAPAYISLDYPQEWLDMFFSEGYHLHDHVLQEFFDTFDLLNWNEVMKKYPADGNPVDETSLDFGLVDGFVHGVCDADRMTATTFLLAGSRIENNPRSKTILRYIIPHLSEALKRVLPAARLRDSGPLSGMEREVLSWVKEGKSSWEISVILGKSERVVNFHVANILTKLNAANRTHAVAIAMGNGIIEF